MSAASALGDPDWVAAIAGLIGAGAAAYAAIAGLKTFKHQQTTNDVLLALSIFEQVNRYWDRAIDQPESQDFNFGQILSYFEVAAALFNDGILTGQAKKILGAHMIEVFEGLRNSEAGQALLLRIRSSETTLEELQKFAECKFTPELLSVTFPEGQPEETPA